MVPGFPGAGGRQRGTVRHTPVAQVNAGPASCLSWLLYGDKPEGGSWLYSRNALGILPNATEKDQVVSCGFFPVGTHPLPRHLIPESTTGVPGLTWGRGVICASLVGCCPLTAGTWTFTEELEEG